MTEYFEGKNAKKYNGNSDCFKTAFKEAGLKGVTVRRNGYSGGCHYYFTIKACEGDFLTFDEFVEKAKQTGIFEAMKPVRNRFSGVFEIYDNDGNAKKYEINSIDPRNLSAEVIEILKYVYNLRNETTYRSDFLKKVETVRKIVKSFKHSDIDSMTDYYDVNFYYDIDIKIA